MKTTIVLVIDHRKPIHNLVKLVEHRAYTIDGVTDANVQQTEFVKLPVREQQGVAA